MDSAKLCINYIHSEENMLILQGLKQKTFIHNQKEIGTNQ